MTSTDHDEASSYQAEARRAADRLRVVLADVGFFHAGVLRSIEVRDRDNLRWAEHYIKLIDAGLRGLLNQLERDIKPPAAKVLSWLNDLGGVTPTPPQDHIMMEFVVGLQVERAPSLQAESHRLACRQRVSEQLTYCQSDVVRATILSDLRLTVANSCRGRFGWAAKWQATFVRQVSLAGPKFSVEEVQREFGAQCEWQPSPQSYADLLAARGLESHEDKLRRLEKMLTSAGTTVNQVRAEVGAAPIAGGDVAVNTLIEAKLGAAACPLGHHLKSDPCRHLWCSCSCQRCRQQCAADD